MTLSYVNAAGVRYIREHLRSIPSADRAAAQAIRKWAAKRGQELDPDRTDVVVLHHQWRHGVGDVGVVAQKMTLTQAVLANWQGESSNNLIAALFGQPWAGHFPDSQHITLVDQLTPPGAFESGSGYQIYNGLFRQSEPAEYSDHTHVQLAAEDFQKFIENLDFHTRFVATLDNYWQQATQTHEQSLRISFIAACNKQVEEGSLSDAGRQLVWQAAQLMPRTPGLQIKPLNVYGYVATDLIYITDGAQQQVLLYLPGNSSPFHEFAGMDAMKDWLAEQCRDAEKRLSLRQYFKLADTPDGLDFSGLDTALDGLGAFPGYHTRSPNRSGFTTDGPWPPRTYVNYRADKYNPLLTGDLFAALALRQRKRAYADADFSITSNAQVAEARWRGYLVTSLNLVAPLALVVPELIPLLALGGVAQFGLGLDQVINGKTLEDKTGGVSNITFGLLNAAPLILLPAARLKVLFPGKRSRFVLPRRVNGQVGYPLSPLDPPRLPEAPAADYFAPSVSSVPPVLADNAPVASYVTRVVDGATGATRLEAVVEEQKVAVLYDGEHDAFILKSDAGKSQPPRYQVNDQGNGLVVIEETNRPVTDAMRTKTLRALGVDLQLPIEIPPINSAEVTPIPKKLLSIWVGDNAIPEDLLQNLAANVKRLRGTRFTYRMYLSNAHSQAFARNLASLADYPAKLEVLTLEEQPFYADFKETEYFEQYQRALAGKHHASACDVIRYPLLNSEGGFYMDVDDTLRTLGDHPDADAVIDSTPLKTTPDGLVLGGPVNNDLLGMQCAYNTNMIGSHADNEILGMIAEEMRERFLGNPTFYDTRPLYGEPDYESYAKELSRMTGPGLFNDVIDQELPRLKVLRQISNLESIPQWNFPFLTEDALVPIANARASDQALSSVVTIGNFHSWGKA